MLKERIQTDFVAAFKAKQDVEKSTLSFLKSKITEAEKANKNIALDDAGVMKVLLTSQKQRKDSISEYNRGGRPDLAAKEIAELEVLSKYLPTMMSEAEIEVEAIKILSTIEGDNKVRKIGQTMGQFNKLFTGKSDSTLLKEVITRLVN